MKFKNLSEGTLYFPLKTNEAVTNGAVYEIVSGKAQKIGSSGITGNLVGVCLGGDKVRTGYVMLDVDPTSIFKEKYSGTAPTIGDYVSNCKLVLDVDTDAKTFTYLLRIKPTTNTQTGNN